MIEFRCQAYPGLTIGVGGRKYRFAGGRLTVAKAEAQPIRDFAAKRPHLGIVETGEVEAPTQAVPNQSSVDQSAAIGPVNPDTMTKAEMIDVAVQHGFERDDLEAMTKAEIADAVDAKIAENVAAHAAEGPTD